jgi:hypothetical protein
VTYIRYDTKFMEDGLPRRPDGKRAMTDAERQRKYRARIRATRVSRLVKDAESWNQWQDERDRKRGRKTPHDLDDQGLMCTAIAALDAAMRSKDWGMVAEAAEMLAKRTGYHPWPKPR